MTLKTHWRQHWFYFCMYFHAQLRAQYISLEVYMKLNYFLIDPSWWSTDKWQLFDWLMNSQGCESFMNLIKSQTGVVVSNLKTKRSIWLCCLGEFIACHLPRWFLIYLQIKYQWNSNWTAIKFFFNSICLGMKSPKTWHQQGTHT